jgi:hypothetical protein
MSMSKVHAASESRLEVAFLLSISGGTCSIANVFPAAASADISVTTDGGAGITAVTIKNFKGPRGAYNIQLTPKVTSMMSAVVSDSYSGNDLTFTISTESDASTATDNVPVFVKAEAY